MHETDNRNWLDHAQYPFEPHYIDLPVGRMHYVDEGEGPPVVMVHGNPTWSFLYRHLISHLCSQYRCVAPDHLGFGLSDKPSGWSYSPEEHARHLALLIEHLDLHDITLIVQDWGGPIGLSYALDHPERVRRIVLMNSWMWPVNRDSYYVAFSMLVGGVLGRFLTRRFNFFANVVLPGVYGDRSRLTAAVHRHYLAPLATPRDREGSAQFPRQILAASAWLGELWERRAKLEGIPKMIVWGMKDIAFRKKELDQWRTAWPEAHVVELADVGHYVQEEAPDRLREAVDAFFAATAG